MSKKAPCADPSFVAGPPSLAYSRPQAACAPDSVLSGGPLASPCTITQTDADAVPCHAHASGSANSTRRQHALVPRLQPDHEPRTRTRTAQSPAHRLQLQLQFAVCSLQLPRLLAFARPYPCRPYAGAGLSRTMQVTVQSWQGCWHDSIPGPTAAISARPPARFELTCHPCAHGPL